MILYNRQWRKRREIFLKANPLCVFCEEEGKIKAADVVDHIEPHRGDMNKFWDESNWQSLCHLHHVSTKQAMESGSEKPLIGMDGFPV